MTNVCYEKQTILYTHKWPCILFLCLHEWTEWCIGGRTNCFSYNELQNQQGMRIRGALPQLLLRATGIIKTKLLQVTWIHQPLKKGCILKCMYLNKNNRSTRSEEWKHCQTNLRTGPHNISSIISYEHCPARHHHVRYDIFIAALFAEAKTYSSISNLESKLSSAPVTTLGVVLDSIICS